MNIHQHTDWTLPDCQKIQGISEKHQWGSQLKAKFGKKAEFIRKNAHFNADC